MSLRRGIPTLTALQAFEASARHQSFSKAAAELQQTHGAVCKNVNELEASLGVPLFHRVSQRLVLTDAGDDYARRIRVHLEQIRLDTQQLITHREQSTLQVAVGVTFGAQWLVPRLAGFYEIHPNIQVRLSGRDQPTYFQDLNFDAAIHFGQISPPGLGSRLLLADGEIWLVGAPSLLRGQGDAAAMSDAQATCDDNAPAPADIAMLPWIHVRDLPSAWMTWLASTGSERTTHQGINHHFDMFIMAIHAATAGLGLALLPRVLIEKELENGQLVRVGDYASVNAEKTYLIFPEQKRDWPPLVKFGAWIQSEMARHRVPS